MDSAGNGNLIEPIAVTEFFVDGFTDYAVENGILTCAGYRNQRTSHGTLRVVVVRVVMPVANLGEAIARATEAASSIAPTDAEPWPEQFRKLLS